MNKIVFQAEALIRKNTQMEVWPLVIAMASCCKKGGDSPSRETITANPLELLASRSLGVILAWHAGFEPATNRLEGGCSVQLS